MKRILKRGWKTLALAAAISLVPTAAFAALGAFQSTTSAPAVTGVSSTKARGAKAVEGRQTGGGTATRYGVLGTANGAGGVGVIGTGTQAGVFSNGPLGVRPGNTLNCSHCVTAGDLAASALETRPLASGESESGVFAAGGGNTDGHIGEGITYPRPLQIPIQIPNVIAVIGGSATHCPGSGSAEAGYLCLYEDIINNVGAGYGFSVLVGSQSVGVTLFWPVTGADSYVGGAYTVTAA